MAVFLIILFFAAIIVGSIMKSKQMNAKQYTIEHVYYITAYNNSMNDSYDLDDYFEQRQKLMSLTRQLAKLEKWYPGKHPLTPKPSVVIKQLDYNYYKQVNSAISRMYLNYKELSRKNGCDFSYLFLSKIQQHRERLSDENTAHAMKLHKELKAYGDIVGTLAEADALDGHVFEEWCAELLKNNGFINVEVTKGSGDQGVDVLAVKDGVRYAVQCKRYSSNLDNTPIQEVFAGKQMYDCHVGAVMTNQYFTSGAKELANKTGVLLWDRDEIQKMLEVQAAGRKAL